ncbi:hypothetical protein J6590_105570, partial [Homalodisca vitripennis]
MFFEIGLSSVVIGSCVIPFPGLLSTLCDRLSSTPMVTCRQPCVKFVVRKQRLGSGLSSLVIDSCVIPIPGLPSTLCDGLSSTPMDRGRKPCVKENVGYASTCNSVGQTAGFFVSFFVFTALESADFCNTYLRTEPLPYGVVTLSSFLKYFGWVFLVTTTLVMLLKREGLPPPDEEPCAGILDTYKQLARVMQLPALKKLAVILLTMS